MAQLNTLIEDLRSEAEFDSVGRFTLDKKKAREKMKKYQLIDPHYYVLEIIQAAVASGAGKIDVYLDADDCIITFDGDNYTREDLDNIYSSLFVSQKDLTLERFRELAIGINSAQALNPAFISVLSGDGKDTVKMQVIPGQEDSFVEPGETFTGTRIHVRERVSWKVASKFFTKYVAQQLPTEGKVIQDRCLFCPVPILVNGRQINPDYNQKVENVLCQVKFDRDSARGILGIPRAPYELSTCSLSSGGLSSPPGTCAFHSYRW